MSFRALLTELTRLPHPTSYNLIVTHHVLRITHHEPFSSHNPRTTYYALRTASSRTLRTTRWEVAAISPMEKAPAHRGRED